MRFICAVACVLASASAALGACSEFGNAEPVAQDAGSSPADAAAPPDAPADAPPDVAPTSFCGGRPAALFCDDFEGNDLAVRWPVQDLELGIADVVDGSSLGRAGKVLRFVRTKAGTAGQSRLHLRRLLGGAIGGIRVAYDLRMKEWPVEAQTSSFTCGNAIHGPLNTWLSIDAASRGLSFLAYSGNTNFFPGGELLGLKAPVTAWEHYEVVVVPGTLTHFELWVGTPPSKLVDFSATTQLPEGGTFSPTSVEVGLTRSNVGPMPEVEAYYDNVVVTAAP